MEAEEEPYCFGLLRRKKYDPLLLLEHETVDTVVERLRKLARRRWVFVGGLEHDEKEARQNAVAAFVNDRELAHMYYRMADKYKAERKRELAKYENIHALIARINEAHRNVGLATSFLASARTLEEILNATPDAATVMDQLRDQLERADEQGEELVVPLQPTWEVDEELEAMIVKQDEREAAELELPDAPRGQVGGEVKQKKIAHCWWCSGIEKAHALVCPSTSSTIHPISRYASMMAVSDVL